MSFNELLGKPLPSMAKGNKAQSSTKEDPKVTDIDTKDIQEKSEIAFTDEENRNIMDRIAAIAGDILIDNEEELKEFVEGVDFDIAVAEGLMTERTIVKFDKNAKRAQLFEIAVASCAREKKDPLYRKLETCYKMERVLKAKLRKKYDAPARKRVKEYLDRARKSKSGILARIANKLSGK